MRINPFLYGVIVLVVFFGIILGFQAAGIWSVSGKVSASGEKINPSAADVNTIKGWMTLEQITTTYNVPLPELLKAFNLPEDTPAATAIKDLESETFDTTALREWLQQRTQPANTAPAQPQPVPTATPVPQATPQPTQHVTTEKTVTGKTTFQELLDWGVPQPVIESIIGGSLPAPSVAVKDYLTSKGLEFSSVKSLLQTEVDKTK
jgi:hypothetical protein